MWRSSASPYLFVLSGTSIQLRQAYFFAPKALTSAMAIQALGKYSSNPRRTGDLPASNFVPTAETLLAQMHGYPFACPHLQSSVIGSAPSHKQLTPPSQTLPGTNAPCTTHILINFSFSLLLIINPA